MAQGAHGRLGPMRHLIALSLVLAACGGSQEETAKDTAGQASDGAGGTSTGSGGSARVDSGAAKGGTTGTGASTTGTGGKTGSGGSTAGTGGARDGGNTGGTQTHPSDAAPGTPAIILDTDMNPDVDDVGALAILHAMADNGEARILAVGISTTNDSGSDSIGFIDAVDTYYGRPDVPVGIYKGGAFMPVTGGYTADIYNNPTKFPRDLTNDKNGVPDATMLYRRTLAAEPDGSVTIACIGPMNNLKRLLESPADADSPLSGTELVKRKVALLVQMGGEYPSGNEFNFYSQTESGMTKAAVDGWPGPIVFTGYEIGAAFRTGGTLGTTPDNNPVRRAYEVHGGARESWDLTAVLYAVRGASTYWDLVTVGSNQVGADGKNAWQTAPDGAQAYLVKKADPSALASLLNDLMTKAPGVKSLTVP
jgi:hypothetical protein